MCGTKNFTSVRLYSAPQSHWTIIVILRICAYGARDQAGFGCKSAMDMPRIKPTKTSTRVLDVEVIPTDSWHAAPHCHAPSSCYPQLLWVLRRVPGIFASRRCRIVDRLGFGEAVVSPIALRPAVLTQVV